VLDLQEDRFTALGNCCNIGMRYIGLTYIVVFTVFPHTMTTCQWHAVKPICNFFGGRCSLDPWTKVMSKSVSISSSSKTIAFVATCTSDAHCIDAPWTKMHSKRPGWLERWISVLEVSLKCASNVTAVQIVVWTAA
jgi:hypothetical protein